MIGPSPDRLQAQFIYGSGGFPSAPRNLTVTWNDPNWDIAWDVPLSDGGSEITVYQGYIDGVGFFDAVPPSTTATVSSQDLAEGSVVWITAINAIGESVASNTVIATISSDSPGIWGDIFGGIWGGIYGRSA